VKSVISLLALVFQSVHALAALICSGYAVG